MIKSLTSKWEQISEFQRESDFLLKKLTFKPWLHISHSSVGMVFSRGPMKLPLLPTGVQGESFDANPLGVLVA